MSFTARFAIALAAGIIAAAIVAPIEAAIAAAAGLRLPFPRIFDRTVMVTVFAAIALGARRLGLGVLIGEGFGRPGENLGNSLRGLGVALAAIALLTVLAIAAGCSAGGAGEIAARAPKYAVAALAIAAIEEGFFRAFILGGMKDDFGPAGALVASAAIYALAHLVRSPERFVVSGYVPAAGFVTLAHSLDRFGDPAAAIPALIGLFILGLVLGKAYLQTGTVYFSIGLHGGLVIGAKIWQQMIEGREGLPGWLAGAGPIPLISGPAAWAIALIILILLPRLTAGKPELG